MSYRRQEQMSGRSDPNHPYVPKVEYLINELEGIIKYNRSLGWESKYILNLVITHLKLEVTK